jgi:hypothetical protein
MVDDSLDPRLEYLLARLDAADAEPDPRVRAEKLRPLVLAVLALDANGGAL